MSIVDLSTNSDKERIERICGLVSGLTENQLSVIECLVSQFNSPYLLIERNENSDLISEGVLADLGDTLRIHHCFSYEPFAKDKFEYALERTLKSLGVHAEMAPAGNPGLSHFITVKHYSQII